MAKAMVRRAIAGRVPFGWVMADAACGFSKGWRHELEQADVFHVMATTRHDTVVTRWSIDHPVHELFSGLPRQVEAPLVRRGGCSAVAVALRRRRTVQIRPPLVGLQGEAHQRQQQINVYVAVEPYGHPAWALHGPHHARPPDHLAAAHGAEEPALARTERTRGRGLRDRPRTRRCTREGDQCRPGAPAGGPGGAPAFLQPQLFSRRWRRRTVFTAVPWFLMDIATYGVGIFTPTLLASFALAGANSTHVHRR
jgi:hypothetical protein